MQQDAQLIFVRMPMVAVIRDVVRKTVYMDVFAREVKFIGRRIHFITQNPNIFPVEKIQNASCPISVTFRINQKNAHVKSNLGGYGKIFEAQFGRMYKKHALNQSDCTGEIFGTF